MTRTMELTKEKIMIGKKITDIIDKNILSPHELTHDMLKQIESTCAALLKSDF